MKAYEYIIRGKDKISNMMKSIAKTAGQTDSALDKTVRKGTALDRTMRKGSISARLFGGSLSFLRSAFVMLSTALVGVGLIGALTGMVKLGAETEQTRIQFQTLTRSVEVGNKLFDEINQFANVTPFNNRDLQKNATTLLAFGTNAADVTGTLKMLGDVSGGNKEKLNSLTLAYSQVQSMGKLMGQDLLQMINAGFNPLNEISQRTGESMTSLKEKMSKGLITADMVTESFKHATSEGGMFNGMMEKMSGTLSGKWSTFVGKVQLKISQFGESNSGVFQKVIDYGIQLVDNIHIISGSVSNLFSKFNPLITSIKEFAFALFGVKGEGLGANDLLDQMANIIDRVSIPLEIMITGLSTVIGWLSGIAKPLAIAIGLIWALNIAMYANPVGLVVAGIIALIGVLVYAYNKVDWFRGAIEGISAVVKDFASIIKEFLITRIKEFISGFTGLGSALMKFFKGDFKGAIADGKAAFKDLAGVDSIKNAINSGKQLGASFTEGYQDGIGKVAENQLAGTKFNFNPGLGGSGDAAADYMAGAGLAGTGTNAGNPTEGTSSITGGGSKQTNITVNLGKLQEQTVINSQTVQEGLVSMEEMVTQMLLRVLNSANQMQTS